MSQFADIARSVSINVAEMVHKVTHHDEIRQAEAAAEGVRSATDAVVAELSGLSVSYKNGRLLTIGQRNKIELAIRDVRQYGGEQARYLEEIRSSKRAPRTEPMAVAGSTTADEGAARLRRGLFGKVSSLKAVFSDDEIRDRIQRGSNDSLNRTPQWYSSLESVLSSQPRAVGNFAAAAALNSPNLDLRGSEVSGTTPFQPQGGQRKARRL